MKIILVLLLATLTAEGAYKLPTYPKPGSAEDKREVAELLNFQKTRTEQQCERAAYEVTVNLETFFGPKYGPLSAAETEKLSALFEKIRATTDKFVQAEKVNWDRPRPFIAHPELTPCVHKETSKAYPSGHAAISRVFALALTKLHPERKAAFLKRADEIAHDRVMSGMHHPSDINEGAKMGDAIYQEKIIPLLKSL